MIAELADGLFESVDLAGAEGIAGSEEGGVAILGLKTDSEKTSNSGARRVRNFMLDYGDARSERA